MEGDNNTLIDKQANTICHSHNTKHNHVFVCFYCRSLRFSSGLNVKEEEGTDLSWKTKYRLSPLMLGNCGGAPHLIFHHLFYVATGSRFFICLATLTLYLKHLSQYDLCLINCIIILLYLKFFHQPDVAFCLRYA